MTRYMRVKSKGTGSEFDLPVQMFDENKYSRVNKAHYPEVSRPRRPKIKVNLAGKRPPKTEKKPDQTVE